MSETTTTERLLTRLAVEAFVVHEAWLLDEWKMDDWLALFTEDASYVVPSTDTPDGDPRSALTLIDDDHLRLYWRVERLKSSHAHREFPWSRTRRMLTNVRVLADDGAEVRAEASQLLHRFRHRHADQFVGLVRWTLVRDGDTFRIRHRRAELDQETLMPNGALSIVF